MLKREQCGTVIKMKNIEKWFGRVAALKGVTFEVGTNETVGLIGDNGAGKSTLVKILAGVFPPTAGELYIRGEKIAFNRYNVQQSRKMGIEVVYQDRSLGEKQALWRNFFVGREITNTLGFIKVAEEKRLAHNIMMNIIGFQGDGITPESNVSALSGRERQGIAIGRAMYFNASLIVLDEPTTALSLSETDKVLNFIRKVKESGRACIFISHILPDVYEVADRFIILNRGQIVGNLRKADVSLSQLTEIALQHTKHGGDAS